MYVTYGYCHKSSFSTIGYIFYWNKLDCTNLVHQYLISQFLFAKFKNHRAIDSRFCKNEFHKSVEGMSYVVTAPTPIRQQNYNRY